MLGANKSSGRRTQQPVRMPIAAIPTAGVGADSGGLSTTPMKAQFPRACTGRRNALDAARAGKKLADGVPAPASDALPRRRNRGPPDAARGRAPKQFQSQGGLPAAILPIDR